MRDETRRSKKTSQDRLETKTFKTETTSLACGSTRYCAEPYSPACIRTIRTYVLCKVLRVHIGCPFTFCKLQSVKTEHVLNSADSCVLFAASSQYSMPSRMVPHSLHVYYVDPDSGHLWAPANALQIRMCRQGCAVPYDAERHHVDICDADTHGNALCLNGPQHC